MIPIGDHEQFCLVGCSEVTNICNFLFFFVLGLYLVVLRIYVFLALYSGITPDGLGRLNLGRLHVRQAPTLLYYHCGPF